MSFKKYSSYSLWLLRQLPRIQLCSRLLRHSGCLTVGASIFGIFGYFSYCTVFLIHKKILCSVLNLLILFNDIQTYFNLWSLPVFPGKSYQATTYNNSCCIMNDIQYTQTLLFPYSSHSNTFTALVVSQ